MLSSIYFILFHRQGVFPWAWPSWQAGGGHDHREGRGQRDTSVLPSVEGSVCGCSATNFSFAWVGRWSIHSG
jgi:hypothetical protein